jgi:hypothetical protein
LRTAGIIGSIALLIGASGAYAATGHGAARAPSLHAALLRTMSTPSERYAFTVRITKDALPVTLHVRGQQSGETISVRLHMNELKMPDGTKLAGSTGAALLLGPFLYERAPSNAVVLENVRWLRVHLADLSPNASELKAVHALTPGPLLRVLGQARMTRVKAGRGLFHGTAAHDDPVVRSSLARLTGGVDFRSLRISAYVGRDGLVHRLLITGRTADRKSTLSLSARLFAFGRPVHVKPPRPGTFMDDKLVQLST